MKKVHASYIHPYTKESILIMSIELHSLDLRPAWKVANIPDFIRELVSLKYFASFDQIDALLVSPRLISGNMGNFLRAALNFIHQVLVNADANLYSLEHIEEGLCRHPEITVLLCQCFEAKFHPTTHDFSRYEKLRDEVLKQIDQLDTGQELHDLRRKEILSQTLHFIAYTLKTNFFQINKTAFVFRLDPLYLEKAPFDRKVIFPELPFGIFFFKGMHFIGYHIRFRDLARGGLRTVFPEKRERMLAERDNVFNECYQLAFTQQKKNKDIPEGGSKGVIFLKPYERLEQETKIFSHELENAGYSTEEIQQKIQSFKNEQTVEYLYQTQRSYIKNFLTLINCTRDGTLKTEGIVDYWKRPEYIYLGPDENMHDSMIEWIAKESQEEGYLPGSAFISSKPGIGINHKTYGVTSLGVNVYMEEVLKFLGIDPLTEAFTVKMTGGPDGDVAGNQIYNLARFYPHTAKLIALTDVSGTIFDPQGLDLTACTQLFKEGKSIRHYPPKLLNDGGFLLDKEEKKELSTYGFQTLLWKKTENQLQQEWLSGNEMNALFRHNVHQVKADVFIPCGGRPRTLNETNETDFLDETGKPTARAIIEGANLYLTGPARRFLEEKGVFVIKDSSANKGGVICSSFEVLVGLCLSANEFLSHKKTLVEEILERIKQCSLNEAGLLLRTHEESGQFLTELSDEISKRINYFTDQIMDHLSTIKLSSDTEDPLNRSFLNYCLPLLRNQYQDRLLNIPDVHKKAIIACHISSTLVYKRGLKWFPSLVDILPLVLDGSFTE